MIKILRILVLIFFTSTLCAQDKPVTITGLVLASGDVDGIHVINKSSNTFATTGTQGDFSILAKINDTLVFSSIKYKILAFKISPETILEQKMIVQLEDQVNVLDEVIVGKVLSGNLNMDVQNTEINKPIDFYDVGIPGYKGKPKTQNERRLYEADAGKMIPYVGLGMAVNFHKLMNAITGRTKMLKERVRLESNDVLMYQMKAQFSDDLFSTYPLNESLRMEFFYYCSEDEYFEARCKDKSDLEIFEFLKEKILSYKKNSTLTKD